ncbi:MAG: hypothetical protein WB799_12915 [Candidatus Sulfotelmatobacter sp.]
MRASAPKELMWGQPSSAVQAAQVYRAAAAPPARKGSAAPRPVRGATTKVRSNVEERRFSAA